jgi:multicomponent Na+:H+ antiporter subunit G
VKAASNVLVLLGAGLLLLAGVGVTRLPDAFARLHAGTKAASLGVAFILAGTALAIPSDAVVVKIVLTIVFQFATAPIAAHVIGRAAYRAGVPLSDRTLQDELAGDLELRPRDRGSA